MSVAICHYNCHVSNMEYEIDTCALMKLSMVVIQGFSYCNAVISASTASSAALPCM